jgi:hypothetical protein
MINGFKIFPGQDVGEVFLHDEDYMKWCNRVNNTYPDGMQLTPDEPELRRHLGIPVLKVCTSMKRVTPTPETCRWRRHRLMKGLERLAE